MGMLRWLLSSILLVACVSAQGQVQRVSNPVLSIAISPTWAGAIESVQVLGYEVINTDDVGREIQPSLYFDTTESGQFCGITVPPYYNTVQAGDLCNVKSRIYAIGSDAQNLAVGVYPRDWMGRGEKPAGLQLEGHHQIGPLAYSSHNEIARLRFRFLNYSGTTLSFNPTTPVSDANGITPIPYVPHAYFRSDQLTRLFGLRDDGAWTEEFPYTAGPMQEYAPSKYKYRAMAWMRADLGWGVALYSRDTLGQPVNFVAEKFPYGGTNNLSVVNQSIAPLANNSYVDVALHLVVGNLGLISGIITDLYNAGY